LMQARGIRKLFPGPGAFRGHRHPMAGGANRGLVEFPPDKQLEDR
jgi:hypothetical protein